MCVITSTTLKASPGDGLPSSIRNSSRTVLKRGTTMDKRLAMLTMVMLVVGIVGPVAVGQGDPSLVGWPSQLLG